MCFWSRTTVISFCTMVETRERERIHLCADSIVDSAHTVADVRCAPTVKPYNSRANHSME